MQTQIPHPLTTAQVEAARREHGTNSLSVRRHHSFLRRFVSNLGDPVIRILLGALAINLVFVIKGADWVETAGIALAVFLATLISTLSEYGSEAAFARLSAACGQATCRVKRIADGGVAHVCEIPVEDVVVGDIILLGAGEMIPADGFLLSGSLQVDQSSMTGESREIDKRPLPRGEAFPDEVSPAHAAALLRGCVIVGGGGEMVVTRVGDSTVLGQISEEVQMDTRESPLKIRLARLAKQISRLGYVAAILVAVVFLLSTFLLDSGFDQAIILAKLSDWRYVWRQCFHALTLGLTVLVVAVPEGLPMMIAVVLSSNIKKMVKDQVLVRKPVGIEAAGSMNVLFTDKTGTLTEGRLSVGRILLGDGQEYADTAAFAKGASELYAYFDHACRTNTASLAGVDRGGDDATKHNGTPHLRALGGNATDRALLDAVLAVSPKAGGRGTSPRKSPAGSQAAGVKKVGVPDGRRAGWGAVPAGNRGEQADTQPGETLYHIPFDSTRKTSAALVRRSGQDVLYVKGAPERLLPHLAEAYRGDGTRYPLSTAARQKLQTKIAEMTRRGGRVILVAEAVGRSLPRNRAMAGDFGSLTLVAMLLLSDRIRREAPEAVATLRRAGIHVVMMTGDNRDTAGAIAESCGILGQGVNVVLDSQELAAMSDEEVRDLLPRIGVIARALPTDKSRLVRISQEADLVVGMTGDGINDAPALKRADIGFAMGAGTQVAKDAGDIIILDNNLRSITRAVLYGRTIFKSIRKFITLQLTMNFCAVGVTMICPFLGVDAPVTVVQMLWINLIMDTLGGLAFAGEAPLASYMDEAPKRRDEPILNRYMVNQIAYLGTFTIVLCLLFLKLPAITELFRPAPDNIYLLTAFFALFIFASVFNCFNARTDRLKWQAGLSRNPAFLAIMAAVLIVQILFVYVGGAVLRTAPLTAKELGVTFLLALTVFPAEFLRKIWRRLSGKGEGY